MNDIYSEYFSTAKLLAVTSSSGRVTITCKTDFNIRRPTVQVNTDSGTISSSLFFIRPTTFDEADYAVFDPGSEVVVDIFEDEDTQIASITGKVVFSTKDKGMRLNVSKYRLRVQNEYYLKLMDVDYENHQITGYDSMNRGK